MPLNSKLTYRATVTLFCVALVAVGTAAVRSADVVFGNASDGVSYRSGLENAKWGSNVTVSFDGGFMRYRSNGIPNHARQAEYALPAMGPRPGQSQDQGARGGRMGPPPDGGRGPRGGGGPGGAPSAANTKAGADPTSAQNYDFQIPLVPKRAATPTSTNLGTIGVMISGAALFNPYEGDGRTVAMANNFTVKNAAGKDVAFLDACNGHPTPMGAYHYHALPPCVTAQVDVAGGPSHIIGVAFDGYPIYGDRDIKGRQVTAGDLDQCGGVTSATPENPDGIYHYVLLPTTDATSSIRCFMGEVTVRRRPMPGM
jgi:hypothetical protein